jgi:hypothetical protein
MAGGALLGAGQAIGSGRITEAHILADNGLLAGAAPWQGSEATLAKPMLIDWC